MAYGISIQNSSGAVIISEDYRNYHLIASGSYANGSAMPAKNAGELLFLRPSSNGAQLYTSFAGGAPVKSTTGAVNYVIVKEGPAPSSDTMGLKVFSASGAIAFDSTRRSLNPVSVTRWSQPAYGGSLGISQPFSPLAGRLRYINSSAFLDTGIAESGQGQFDYWRSTWVQWTSDNSMTANEGVNPRESAKAPGGTDFPAWAGVLLFSFADI